MRRPVGQPSARSKKTCLMDMDRFKKFSIGCFPGLLSCRSGEARGKRAACVFTGRTQAPAKRRYFKIFLIHFSLSPYGGYRKLELNFVLRFMTLFLWENSS